MIIELNHSAFCYPKYFLGYNTSYILTSNLTKKKTDHIHIDRKPILLSGLHYNVAALQVLLYFAFSDCGRGQLQLKDTMFAGRATFAGARVDLLR